MKEFVKEDVTREMIQMSFRNYVSTLSHMLKYHGDKEFIDVILEQIDLCYLLKSGEIRKLLYLIGCVEYLCRINDLEVPEEVMEYQSMKMPFLTFSEGTEIYCRVVGNDTCKKEELMEAIPELLNHNIVETDIRGAC
jgi:hypothetical protein